MELNYDWKSFQSIFYSRSKLRDLRESDPAGVIYLVVDGETIIAVYSAEEDFSEWIGSPYLEIASEFSHREFVLFERKEMDQRLKESLLLSHTHDQIGFLRNKTHPQVISHGKTRHKILWTKPAEEFFRPDHFLLEAIQGWWSRIFPAAYGVFIRLEASHPLNFFFLVRGKRLELFHEPDLTGLGTERSRQPADVVKYLSEKYLLSVQGCFLPAQEWQDWMVSPDPWRKMARAIHRNHAKLVPFRWNVMFLVTIRGWIGI